MDRPQGVTILGWLAIVFGAIGLIVSVMGIVGAIGLMALGAGVAGVGGVVGGAALAGSALCFSGSPSGRPFSASSR